MVAPVSAVVIAPCDNPNLVSKDSNWNVTDGACGYLYVDTGGKFTFYGYGLDSGTAYSLIYYPDNDTYPWNSAEKGLKVFGTAPCVNGRVTISDNGFWTGIPSSVDTNKDIKVWLVPASDVATDHMTAWNPEQYLFEKEPFPTNGEICPEGDVLPNDSDLCQKEVLVGDSNPWPVITHGAHAVMTYDGKTVNGLKAYRLTPETEYALIYYPDIVGNPYPDHPITVIDNTIRSDSYGYASMESITFDIFAEPILRNDINYKTEKAVKFWLVPKVALNGTGTGINWNDPDSFLFEQKLIEIIAPVPEIDITGESVYVGQPMTATATVIPGENVAVKQWRYNFGDGTVIDYTTETLNATHTYANAGTYTLWFGVWDEFDTKYVTNVPVTVYPVPAPEIIFNATPNEGLVPGDVVTFSIDIRKGTDIPGDVNITGWVLDFGDGNSTSGTDYIATVTNVYNVNTIYTATLTVTDEYGMVSTETISINVGNVPSPTLNEFYADPIIGESPLTVDFSGIIDGDAHITVTGVTIVTNNVEIPAVLGEAGAFTANYTYTADNQYPVSLKVSYTVNGMAYEETFTTDVVITVGTVYLSATPVSGEVSTSQPLSVTFTDGTIEPVGAYKEYVFGDGASLLVNDVTTNMTVTHAYVKAGTYTATLTYYTEENIVIGQSSVDITATAQRGGGSGRQHRANINLDDDATFIPLTGAYAGFEKYLQFSISDSQGVDEVLSAYMRGGEISFPGPIPGPLQNGQCVMDYPYIISDGFVEQSAVWGNGLATDVYMTNPGKKIRLNVWKKNNLPSEMTFMVYDKNKEHLLYEETFDVKKQMFDISFELPTGVVSDMIEPWE
jgi:PKD repeat protein